MVAPIQLTEEQALTIAHVLNQADGGCHVCAGNLGRDLAKLDVDRGEEEWEALLRRADEMEWQEHMEAKNAKNASESPDTEPASTDAQSA